MLGTSIVERTRLRLRNVYFESIVTLEATVFQIMAELQEAREKERWF